MVTLLGILQGMTMSGISSIGIQTLAVLKRLLQNRDDLPPEVKKWLEKEVRELEKNKVDF